MNQTTIHGITIGLLTALLIMTLYMGISTYRMNEDFYEKEQRWEMEFQKLDYYPDRTGMQRIEEVGKMFANNHNYTEDVYDCTQYSDDLYEVFKQIGIESTKVIGCRKTNSSVCHKWLKISLDFEPIWGGFTDYTDEFDIHTMED